MSLAPDLFNALVARASPLRPPFEVVLDYESGTWEQLTISSRAVRLNENFIPDLYLRAVMWVEQIFVPAEAALHPAT